MSEKLRTLPWYDRNPKSKADHYLIETKTPHSTQTPITYLCPKEKIAMVELLIARIVRKTAADSASEVGAEWKLTPLEQEIKYILNARLTSKQNDEDDKDEMTLSGNIMLFPGDKLEGLTFDNSTGGSCHYFMCYKITEFDAFPIEETPFEVQLPKRDLQQPKKPWWQWW